MIKPLSHEDTKFTCFRCGYTVQGPYSVELGNGHHCPAKLHDECPDCWHRWKYHGPKGSNGCGAPGCGCSEPDSVA